MATAPKDTPAPQPQRPHPTTPPVRFDDWASL